MIFHDQNRQLPSHGAIFRAGEVPSGSQSQEESSRQEIEGLKTVTMVRLDDLSEDLEKWYKMQVRNGQKLDYQSGDGTLKSQLYPKETFFFDNNQKKQIANEEYWRVHIGPSEPPKGFRPAPRATYWAKRTDIAQKAELPPK